MGQNAMFQNIRGGKKHKDCSVYAPCGLFAQNERTHFVGSWMGIIVDRGAIVPHYM